MIRLENISKSYGKQAVLSGLNLELNDGGRLAVMGRSGAGKTTLLNIIMGLIKPDSGSVLLPEGARLGAVFQEDRLIEPLTAAANCKIVMPKGADAGRIPETLGSLGITPELSEKPVSELSGGERRRVAAARMILSEPDIFILDEPFKGIDSETLPKVTEAVSKAAEGKTLMLVTHSPDEAEALGCRVMQL